MLRSSWPAGPSHPLHRPLSLSPDRARSLSLEAEPPASFLVRSAALEDLTSVGESPLELEEFLAASSAAPAAADPDERMFGNAEPSGAAYGERQPSPGGERGSAPNPSGSLVASASFGLEQRTPAPPPPSSHPHPPAADRNSEGPGGEQLHGAGPIFPSPPPSRDSSPLGPRNAARMNGQRHQGHGDDGQDVLRSSASGPTESRDPQARDRDRPVSWTGDAQGSEKNESGASPLLKRAASQSSPARKSYVPVAQFKGLLCYAHRNPSSLLLPFHFSQLSVPFRFVFSSHTFSVAAPLSCEALSIFPG